MKLHYLLWMLPLLGAGCGGDDDPVIENEPELITDITLTLSPRNPNEPTVTLAFNDPDGEGPAPATRTEDGVLTANTTYVGNLEFRNASDPDDVEFVNAEISAEATDHQVFYVARGLSLDLQYTDFDADGAPLGLTTLLTTRGAGRGTLTVTLRHEPSKGNSGVTISTPERAGGTTDAEVVFPITVQ